MATMITDHCTNCGACVAECPNDAISWPAGADSHVIDPDRCSECVGFHGAEACQMVCPSECCLPDPSRPETEAELLAKAKRLHPELADRLEATPRTSRFRR
jgi:ferredoxin